MTTKYKHRQTGDIAEKIPDTSVIGYYNTKSNIVPAKYIEGCSDWEPVQDSLYEIESYKSSEGVWYYSKELTANPEYRNYCLNHMGGIRITGSHAAANETEYSIHSIKILSTQEVITVGDKVCWEWVDGSLQYLTVKEWALDITGKLLLYPKETSNYHYVNALLRDGYNLRKYTEPVVICTTVDGRGLTSLEDLVYGVYTSDWQEETATVKEVVQTGGIPAKDWKMFSSETARTEWILMNKPAYSLKDIEDKITGKGGAIIDRLKREQQEKLKQHG